MTGRAIVPALVALVVAGCSTHERKFEADVPPAPGARGASADQLGQAAAAIVLHYRDRTSQLATDDLAALTQASALTFRATGAPGIRSLTRQYADALLDGRVASPGGDAFFSVESKGKASAPTTAAASTALVDAFDATGDPRYAAAARSAAEALGDGSLGVVKVRGGLAVRDPARKDGARSVALTAVVAHALRRAAVPAIGARTAATSRSMLEALAKAQAGLGRWYAYFGMRTPMDMEQWATTLLTVTTIPRDRGAAGVAGGGVPALWRTGFTQDGQPRTEALPDPSGRGQPIALSTFQAFAADPTYARLGVQRAYERRRADGTIDRAAESDTDVQALYASALARRSVDLRREEPAD